MNRPTAGYPGDDRNGMAYAPTHQNDSARTFRVAMRHSRRVRWLRIGVPLGAVVALLAIVLATWLRPLAMLARLPTEVGTPVISGTQVTMQNPRLTGFTRDSRAYEVSARAASQDITKPDTMELRELHAKMELPDRNVIEMSAARGIYDTKAEVLKLVDKILLTSSSGYEGQLTEAVIDVRKGHVVSDKPVALKMLNGVLNANRLEVVGGGDVIRFDGGVVMVLTLNRGAAPAAAKAGRP